MLNVSNEMDCDNHGCNVLSNVKGIFEGPDANKVTLPSFSDTMLALTP